MVTACLNIQHQKAIWQVHLINYNFFLVDKDQVHTYNMKHYKLFPFIADYILIEKVENLQSFTRLDC